MLKTDEINIVSSLVQNIFNEVSQLPNVIVLQEKYNDLPADKKFSASFESIISKRTPLDTASEQGASFLTKKLFLIEELSRINLYLELMSQELDTIDPPLALDQYSLRKYWKQILGAILVITVTYFGLEFRRKDHGLIGRYYLGTNFESFFRKRLDRAVSFSWGAGGPFIDMPADFFSVRWKGFLKVDKAGSYEFKAGSDDGIRVWIQDKKIVDTWFNHSWLESNAAVDLPAGYVPIQVDYYEYNFGAAAYLGWRNSPDEPFDLITEDNLRTVKPS
jgi:hypothetical protein